MMTHFWPPAVTSASALPGKTHTINMQNAPATQRPCCCFARLQPVAAKFP